MAKNLITIGIILVALGQGKVKSKIFRLQEQITWQPAKIHFLQQWPAKTKGDEDNANGDQGFCHVLPLQR